MSTILELNNIKKAYDVKMAVDIDKLVIEDGDCVGLVGESGCGKSVTSMSILHLLPPKGRIVDGTIRFKGRDITHLPPAEMAKLRGKEIAMIFQEPAIHHVYHRESS